MKKLLFLMLMLASLSICHAQENGRWQADWSASVRVCGSTGEYVPFWARTGEDGILPIRSSGLVVAGGDVSYEADGGWHFEGGINIVGALAQQSVMNHREDYALVDRLYASANWKMLHLDLGMKPRRGDLGPLSITGGNVLLSGNARNIPGINLYTDWISFKKFRWFAFKGNLAHHHMIDTRFVKGTMVHDKSLSARFSIGSRIELLGGLRHFAMWGGVSEKYGTQATSFKDYIKVFFAEKGGEDDLLIDQYNVFGNHIGTEWVRVVWHADRFAMTFQYDKLFEDGSGKDFYNAPDGVWTLSFAFADRNALVTDLTYEYIHTTWQSGPLHDRPATEEEMAGQDPDSPWYGKVSLKGRDDYFNNNPYNSGWTYYGRTIGLPLLIPYAPDADGRCKGIINNRVRGHHLGMSGIIAKVPYTFKATFTKNYGRYVSPLPGNPWQLSIALEATLLDDYKRHPVGFTVGAYADVGKLYQNSVGFVLKTSYRGSRRF